METKKSTKLGKKNLATRFNIDPDAAVTQWKKVLRHLITEETAYCSKKYFDNGKDPSFFWSFYMNKNIGWGEDILKLLQIVLVLPSNSADAERSFSILNYVRYDRRTKLTPKHTEDLVRIRFNGPGEIEQFPADKYARLWKKKNHFLTDEKKQKQNENNDVEIDDQGDYYEDIRGRKFLFMRSTIF